MVRSTNSLCWLRKHCNDTNTLLSLEESQVLISCLVAQTLIMPCILLLTKEVQNMCLIFMDIYHTDTNMIDFILHQLHYLDFPWIKDIQHFKATSLNEAHL